ncbi:MAG: HU family DNA-binding protein [Succinivibrionaceae bacterium]
MTSSEFVNNLSSKLTDISVEEISGAVDDISRLLTVALDCNKRIEIRNFGTFATKVIGARKAYNPKTDRIHELASKRAIQFRVGKGLSDRLNPNA